MVRSWKIEFIIISIKKYVVLFSQISIINSAQVKEFKDLRSFGGLMKREIERRHGF